MTGSQLSAKFWISWASETCGAAGVGRAAHVPAVRNRAVPRVPPRRRGGLTAPVALPPWRSLPLRA